MNDLAMNFIGKEVSWKQDGQHVFALIDQHLRDGETSSVYVAKTKHAEVEDKKFVVKIFKEISSQYDASQEESEERFLDEIEILLKVRETQERNWKPITVPYAYYGTIEGKSVLVMEFLEIEYKWNNCAKSENFRRKGVFEASLDALELFDLVLGFNYANSDVKGENFYWLPNDEERNRLVVLDWNRCIEDNNFDESAHQKFVGVKNDMFRSLVEIIYRTIWGEIPNPLPPIDNTDSDDWHLVPRFLRRLVFYVREQEVISGKWIEERIQWYLGLNSLIDNQDWQGVRNKLQSLQENTFGSMLETVEITRDAVDLLLKQPYISDDMRAEIVELRNWADEKEKDEDLIIKNDYEDSLKKVREQQPNDARQLCETTLDSISASPYKLWPTARLLAISEYLSDCLARGLYQADVYQSLVKYLVDADQYTLLEVDHEWREESQLLFENLEKANQIQEFSKQYRASSGVTEKIKYAEKIENSINEIQDRLPLKTIEVLRKIIPVYNLSELQDGIYSSEGLKKQNEKLNAVKEKILEVFREKERLSEKEVYGILIDADVQFDSEIVLLKQILDHAVYERWKQAFDLVLYEIAETPFLGELKLVMISSVNSWLEKLDKSRKIYKDEINELNSLLQIPVVKDKFRFTENLKTRIEVYQAVNPDDTETLQKCHQYGVEPWIARSELPNQSIDRVLWLAELRKNKTAISKELNELDLFISENNLLSFEEYCEKKQYLDTLQQKLLKVDEISKNQLRLKYDLELNAATVKKAEEIIQELKIYLSDAKKHRIEINHEQEQIAQSLKVLKEKKNKNVLDLPTIEHLTVFRVMSLIMQGQYKDAISDLKDTIKWIEDSRPESEAITQQVVPSGGMTRKKLTVLRDWDNYLNEVARNKILAQDYTNWMKQLARQDQKESVRYLRKLYTEQNKPIFEYLAARHGLLFSENGQNFSKNEEWLKLFKDGKLEDLVKDIDSYEEDISQNGNSSEKMFIQQWKDNALLAQNYANLLKEASNQKSWVHKLFPVLNYLLPKSVVDAAMMNKKRH